MSVCGWDLLSHVKRPTTSAAMIEAAAPPIARSAGLPPGRSGAATKVAPSRYRSCHAISGGSTPKSTRTPKTAPNSKALTNISGFQRANASGGRSVSVKGRAFRRRKGRPIASEKKSLKPSTKPMKEVAMAKSEKISTPVPTSGSVALSTASGSSAPAPMPDRPRMTASQMRNMVIGAAVPATIALRTLVASPSRSAQTTGTTLW
mmetsp:Transcript_9700/g.31752  ORF Transcript_9700/g.31752 Transcript_9700/m.31752 type:complete len:205 (+) Transcript_9700:69-683(+)